MPADAGRADDRVPPHAPGCAPADPPEALLRATALEAGHSRRPRLGAALPSGARRPRLARVRIRARPGSGGPLHGLLPVLRHALERSRDPRIRPAGGRTGVRGRRAAGGRRSLIEIVRRPAADAPRAGERILGHAYGQLRQVLQQSIQPTQDGAPPVSTTPSRLPRHVRDLIAAEAEQLRDDFVSLQDFAAEVRDEHRVGSGGDDYVSRESAADVTRRGGSESHSMTMPLSRTRSSTSISVAVLLMRSMVIDLASPGTPVIALHRACKNVH